MSIESPNTYGEMYWKSQYDAAVEFAELEEEAIKPFIPSIFDDPDIRESIPFDILSKYEGMIALEHPGLFMGVVNSTQTIFEGVLRKIMGSAGRKIDWATNKRHQFEHLPAEQYAGLYRRKFIEEDTFKLRLEQWGLNEFERKSLYAITDEHPSIRDLFISFRYSYGSMELREKLKEFYDVSAEYWSIWDYMSRQHLTSLNYITANIRGQLTDDDFIEWMDRLGWDKEDAAYMRNLSYDVPNAMLLVQGDLHNNAQWDYILDDIGYANIHPDYQQKYLDAVLTKPSSSDMIAFHLRQENNLMNLGGDLRRIGIHPDWFNVYHTLANRIPPVADIITMAVREAFTPEVAERFGQYEDFPPDFGRYAQQQGLSLEWSMRYWAAHWGLPSPQQGFQMLHRGVIDEHDLNMLMKAQDIMPFWRDKMTAIAYRTLTRVDVRRMYALGVLDLSGVYESYQDAGYSDKNAERMTAFTEAYVKEQQTHSAKDDIVKAYRFRMIDRSTAASLLQRAGVEYVFALYMLDDIEYQREWERVTANMKGIRNLYKKGIYDENAARAELASLNLPGNTIDLLMEQWWYEKKTIPTKTWSKAETIGFMKAKIISPIRGRQELEMMGYDKEHVDVYMGAIEWN